jgi:cell division protein FtsB
MVRSNRCRGVRRAAMMAIGLLAVACSGKKDFTTENDALRSQLLAAQQEVEQLRRRSRELEAELQSASTVSQSLPADIREATGC